MSAFGHVLFNLLCNSIGSFVAALVIVYAAQRCFRGGLDRRGELWLLLLPFGKMLFDLAQGVPASSFLWAKLAGQTQDLGSFRIGLGLSQTGVSIMFELGAFSHGLIYPQSLADLLDTALSKRVGAWVPCAIAIGWLGVGMARLMLRIARSRTLLQRTLRNAPCVEVRRSGWRNVAVRVSSDYAGVPFAAGMFRPTIVFSARAYDRFDAAEREAVLAHELAHVAHYDPVLQAGLCVLDDLFWFMPGARGLLGRIHAMLELRADDAALATGAQAGSLASALVAAGEIVRTPIVSAAMASQQSLLGTRVQRLLCAPAPTVSRGIAGSALGLLLIAGVTFTVAQTQFFGNHAAALVRFATG